MIRISDVTIQALAPTVRIYSYAKAAFQKDF